MAAAEKFLSTFEPFKFPVLPEDRNRLSCQSHDILKSYVTEATLNSLWNKPEPNAHRTGLGISRAKDDQIVESFVGDDRDF
jgi:hypothetical protein